MNRDFRKTIQTLVLLMDVALLTAVFFLWWSAVYNPLLPIPFFRRGNYVLYLIYAAIMSVSIALMKGHRVGHMRAGELALAQIIAVLLANIVTYFQISLLNYRMMPVDSLLLMTLVQFVATGVWAFASNRIFYKVFGPQKIALIYDDPARLDVAAKLGAIQERYQIACSLQAQGDAERIEAAITGYPSVLLCVTDPALQERLIRYCYQNQKRLYFFPNVADVIKNGAERIHVVDSPLLLCRNGRLSAEERMWKRLTDIVLSLAAILVLSPLMLLAALAVWLYDRKNIIYTQPRLTRGGKIFRTYKLRSMVVDAEKDGVQLASLSDARITPVGRVLRKYRIDELPQLFNVLLGDMSIVGPRPERPELAAEYERALPAFRYRLNVKAGLTGNAQVYGNYDTSSEDKLLMDLMYIENYSFLHDLSLMFQTLRIVLTPSRAEGFADTDAMSKPQDLSREQTEKSALP